MEGEGVVIERVAQQWFQHFNTGEENTKDLPRSGRPKLQDMKNIRSVLRGRNFENVEAVEVGLNEFFASKTRDGTVAG